MTDSAELIHQLESSNRYIKTLEKQCDDYNKILGQINEENRDLRSSSSTLKAAKLEIEAGALRALVKQYLNKSGDLHEDAEG